MFGANVVHGLPKHKVFFPHNVRSTEFLCYSNNWSVCLKSQEIWRHGWRHDYPKRMINPSQDSDLHLGRYEFESLPEHGLFRGFL
jgi:hypothetical protein